MAYFNIICKNDYADRFKGWLCLAKDEYGIRVTEYREEPYWKTEGLIQITVEFTLSPRTVCEWDDIYVFVTCLTSPAVATDGNGFEMAHYPSYSKTNEEPFVVMYVNDELIAGKYPVIGCDLHTHSTYSDGTFSPAELIEEAKRRGIAIALTDHNTVAGAPEFIAEAEAQGVTAVVGTELTVDYKGKELHLLGLFISPDSFGAVEELTEKYARLKERNNEELVKRLNAAGYDIDLEAVKARTAKGNVNRAHIAAELVEKGYVSSRNEAFDTLLKEGNGFYYPSERLDIFEAIRFLKGIKALPVLAHPMKELEEKELRALLPEAIPAGLIGMEVMHSDYSKEKTEAAVRIAEEFGLLPSGGSDFHGANKPSISLETGKGQLSVPIRFYNGLESAWSRLF